MSYGSVDRTSQTCPKCGAEIVYSGNYFCEDWTYPYEGAEGTCDWAMGESAEDEKLFKLCYAGLMANRAKDEAQRAGNRRRIG